MNHFKTSLAYIRRSPFQALAAISVLAITFFIATLLSLVIYSSNQVLKHFETRPQVIAFLSDESTIEQIDSLRNKLESDGRVKDLNYVSKEQALEIYKEATADNPLLAELVSPSIFPASLEFSVTELSFASELVDEIKSLPAVDSVGFTASIGAQNDLDQVVESLKRVTLYIRIGGASLAAILAFSSFLILLVVIGMRIASRREEIETLDLIGAKPGFIKAPFIYEAINYSLIGVFLGWLMAVILLLHSTPSVLSYFGTIPVLPRETDIFFILLGLLLLLEIFVGLVIALGGSMMAISRARRRK